jgi:hypothetical protein
MEPNQAGMRCGERWSCWSSGPPGVGRARPSAPFAGAHASERTTDECCDAKSAEYDPDLPIREMARGQIKWERNKQRVKATKEKECRDSSPPVFGTHCGGCVRSACYLVEIDNYTWPSCAEVCQIRSR